MKSACKRQLFALVLLALPACDDGITGSTASCQSYCAKLETCDDSTDLLGCEQMCSQQKVRSDGFLAARAQCADKLSCNQFAGEVGLMGEDTCASGQLCKLDDCTNNALADQKISSEQMSYCSSISSKLNACDHTLDATVVLNDCIDLAPTLSTAYLDDTSTCVQGDCTTVVACLKRTADRYDTDLSLYPGSLATN